MAVSPRLLSGAVPGHKAVAVDFTMAGGLANRCLAEAVFGAWAGMEPGFAESMVEAGLQFCDRLGGTGAAVLCEDVSTSVVAAACSISA